MRSNNSQQKRPNQPNRTISLKTNAKEFVPGGRPNQHQKQQQDEKKTLGRVEKEKKIVELYKNFHSLVCDVSESFINNEDSYVDDNKKLIDCMREHKKLAGYTPYALFDGCPDALIEYITLEGVTRKVKKHLSIYVSACISDTVMGLPRWSNEIWNKLKLFVTKSQEELYINKVGNVDALITASDLGFKDSRLESAIINIQRMIRQKDERINFKIQSFKELADKKFYAPDEELSIVKWNSHCIPEYISLLRQNIHQTSILQGIDRFIFENDTDSLSQLVYEYKYRIIAATMFEYDTIYKMLVLLSYITRGNLATYRYQELNSLKFIVYQLKECAKASRFQDTCINKKDMVRLISLPVASLVFISNKLKEFDLSIGKDLMCKLLTLDIDKLEADQVRKWYLDIITESDEDATKKSEITVELLKRFLDHEIDIPVVENFCREKLAASKEYLLKHKRLVNFCYNPDKVEIANLSI